MPMSGWQTFVFPCLAALGCGGPSLDLPTQGPKSSWSLEVTSGEAVSQLPLLFRGRVSDAPQVGKPLLLRGELSNYYERAVARGELPKAVQERAVPLRFWREQGACWLQPLDWLTPDEDYALVFIGVGTLQLLHTTAAPQSHATRLFPPPSRPKHAVTVLCDMAEPPASALLLEPGAVPLEIRSGMAGSPLPGCVTLSAQRSLTESAVSPPTLAGTLLDPAPWLPPSTPVAPRDCAGEPAVGACVQALDDRVLVTPRALDQLWLLDGAGHPTVASAGAASVLLRGLVPESDVELHGSVLASDGSWNAFSIALRTAPPRRHVVLNEVLANPLGPEASGEWIELLNDSASSARLLGLWLEDAGGHVALPDVELRPGELSLLVPEGFQSSGLDVPIPSDVRRISLPTLGARGLANGGEALLLVGEEGVVSRFPLIAATHAGRSIARRASDAPDDAATSFAEHGGRGASPGAANSFDD
jgi:hypothetical protein